MNKNIVKLIDICNHRIKGYSTEKHFENLLPIYDKELSVFVEDGKMFFVKEKQVSYFWTEDGYFSNIEILKRIGHIYGIKLENENIYALTSFSLKMKKLAQNGGN